VDRIRYKVQCSFCRR